MCTKFFSAPHKLNFYGSLLRCDLLFPSILQLDVNELNNTRKATKDVLFFNRVPKVGSQTTMELLKSLSIKNNFHYHKDRTQKVETIKLTYNEEVRIRFNELNHHSFQKIQQVLTKYNVGPKV